MGLVRETNQRSQILSGAKSRIHGSNPSLILEAAKPKFLRFVGDVPASCGSSCTSCRCRTGTGRCGRPSRRGCGSAPASSSRSPAFVVVPSLRRRPSAAEPRRPRRAGRSPTDLLEALLLLHAEDGLRHLVLDALPHLVELLHALPLVLDLRVHPGRSRRRPMPLPQVVHRQQVVLPGVVELVEQQAPLHAAHLGPVACRRRRSTAPAGPCPRVTPVSCLGRDLDAAGRLAPLGQLRRRPRPRTARCPRTPRPSLASIVVLRRRSGSARRLTSSSDLLQLGSRLGAELLLGERRRPRREAHAAPSAYSPSRS